MSISAFEEGDGGTLAWAQDLHVGMLFLLLCLEQYLWKQAQGQTGATWSYNTQVKLDVSAASSVADLYFFEGALGLLSL